VSVFQNLWKSTVAYIKSFSIKTVVSVSRAETTMLRGETTTTRTVGIPTRPSSLHQILVPRTQCCKWTMPDTLQFKWKNNHSRAVPVQAQYTIFLFFYRLKVHNMWSSHNSTVMLYLWMKSQNGRVCLF